MTPADLAAIEARGVQSTDDALVMADAILDDPDGGVEWLMAHGCDVIDRLRAALRAERAQHAAAVAAAVAAETARCAAVCRDIASDAPGDASASEAADACAEAIDATARDAAGELLVAIPTPGTDAARVMVASRIMRGQRDAALTDAARLRAIVEGRTIAPSDAEIEAHAAAGGWWLLHSLGSHPGASSLAALALDAEQAQRAARVQRDRGEGAHRWHAMLDGRPCPWPVAP